MPDDWGSFFYGAGFVVGLEVLLASWLYVWWRWDIWMSSRNRVRNVRGIMKRMSRVLRAG